MPRPSRIDPASRAVVAELLATDADLHALGRQFLLNGLNDLINLQRRGDPAIRAQIARALAGPVVAAITERPDDDDGLSQIRAEMHEMMDEFRATILPPRADEDTDARADR